ncbi:YCF48-related protein [Rhodohalobacter mucosus]|uniref:Photosynthesis system II assembly factor Ycf48/Hcf136-like domain-containing protein n=1 Tax=Rhodohalobacter mucosus TaxID=2079485 RepID=A0A316TSG2_9BACT|nr:YCF48-related protein [Rhodohalobacter mucosus]PWN06808.1 hypothetical protein DDZ15_05920 [Rhodohalobacter mucosus]
MRYVPIFALVLFGLFGFSSSQPCLAQSLSIIESGSTKDLYAVYFSDQLHGWAVGEAGTILRTSDGGSNWEQIQTQYSDSFFEISFFDHQTGWIAGGGEILLFTNNAGRNWADYRPGSTGARHIHTLYSSGLNRVQAGGGPAQWFYASENSGLTWQRNTVLPEACTIRSLHFTDPDTGFFTACGAVWNSRDGGQTWMRLNSVTSHEAELHSLFMTGSDAGYAIAADDSGTFIQRIEVTQQDYELFERSESAGFTALSFLNDRTGWASAQNGGLWQTSDGGKNWEKIETGIDADLLDIHALESGTVWISGNGGTLIRLDFPVTHVDPVRIQAPDIFIESDSEAIELLNRVLKYGDFAMQLDDPLQRSNLYRRMVLVMQGIQSYYSSSRMPQGVADHLRDIPAIYFAAENNRGAEIYNRYLESPENIPDDSLHTAINHFTNAAIIMPDSSTSWLNLAYARLQSGNAESALSAAEVAFERSQPTDAGIGLYDLLIRLYMLTDQRNLARITALDANTLYPEEPIFLEYLADLEISMDDPGQSVSSGSLDRLIETYPEEPRYRYARALGVTGTAMDLFERATVLQEMIWDLDMRRFGTTDAEELKEIQGEKDRLTDEKSMVLNEAYQLTDQASRDLTVAINNDPDHTESYALSGRINVNIASFLEEIRLLTIDEEEAMRLNEEIDKRMREAADYYRQAADLDPANRVYRAELEQIKRFLNQ